MPAFIFCPPLVALLGLGLLSAILAVVISTLSGLDGVHPVLRKIARVGAAARPARTFWLVMLLAAMPSLFGGLKLALSYALIEVIAGDFILAGSGPGYAISFAWQGFDNRAMYGLMLRLGRRFPVADAARPAPPLGAACRFGA